MCKYVCVCGHGIAVLAPMFRAYLELMLALTMCQWLVGTHGTRLDSHMWPCRVSCCVDM